MECLKTFSVVVLGFVVAAIHCQLTDHAGEGSASNSEQEVFSEYKHEHNVSGVIRIAWIEKPPYATSPGNESWDKEVHGMFRDALLLYIAEECSYHTGNHYGRESLKVGSEIRMIELLRQNKVHIAFPIFEKISNRQYSEFPFFKLDDYPGTEYITNESQDSVLSVVVDSVLGSWPLLAVTLVLTAIAGVIMWSLDTYWNSEEFPRSFIKGSWDGFWWSFISMTTVGYGDKSPKSIIARIFSIIWILFGVIIMTIFVANVTTALTAVSLEIAPSNLAGLKDVIKCLVQPLTLFNLISEGYEAEVSAVAVLGNGTEYQHALQEGAHPHVYNNIDDIVHAVKSEKVDGMLLDRYATSFYQERGKFKSLLIVKKFNFGRDVGVLFSRDRKDIADCLDYYRSNIWQLVDTITKAYKLTKQKPTRNFNLFDESSLFIKRFLYISVGALGGLLLIGTVWEIVIRKRVKVKQNAVEGFVNREVSTERETIQEDLETARTLLRQMEERLNKLEAKVSRLQLNQ